MKLNIPKEESILYFVVDKKWLVENLENEEIKIVDSRYDLDDPSLGKELYQTNHIPGAFYFDLKEQLSAPVAEHGGRHPLPDLNEFKRTIENVGIDNSKTVIVYDNGSGEFASRFWWMLKYVGHEKVYILDEGFSGWQEAIYPVTVEISESTSAEYVLNIQDEMLASYEDVKEIVENEDNDTTLIDSRAYERYTGEVEPIDKSAGHIPGAINKLWIEGLHDGSFTDSKKQKERFSELDSEEPIIVYCGSGVTATPNYIALKMAGFENVKLYAGSFSDWISYEDNEVEKGDPSKNKTSD